MLYAAVLIVILTAITELYLGSASIDARTRKQLRILYWWHLAFVLVYYLYARSNASDSWAYYDRVMYGFPGDIWLHYYGVGTGFIHFVAFPFIRVLGFTYEACMVLFGYLGYIGWSLVYRTFLERTEFRHKINIAGFRMSLLTLIIFLPNNHFWSASLGKGALIVLGIGLVLYGLSRPQKRIWILALGAIMTYHVRPHILYAIVLAAAIGIVFSRRGLPRMYRWTLSLIACVAIVYLFYDLQSLPQFEEFFTANSSSVLHHQAMELGKAESGVEITTMSLPLQVFTFLYRPLFFDAHNALAWYTSCENLLYLWLTFMLFRKDFIRFIRKSDYLVITALITFLAVATILAQISGNLGLAMRQKSQVFFLLFFVLLQYKDYRAGKFYERQAAGAVREPGAALQIT